MLQARVYNEIKFKKKLEYVQLAAFPMFRQLNETSQRQTTIGRTCGESRRMT